MITAQTIVEMARYRGLKKFDGRVKRLLIKTKNEVFRSEDDLVDNWYRVWESDDSDFDLLVDEARQLFKKTKHCKSCICGGPYLVASYPHGPTARMADSLLGYIVNDNNDSICNYHTLQEVHDYYDQAIALAVLVGI